MKSDWNDDFFGDTYWAEELEADDEGLGEAYCPYTGGAECAMHNRGWQPQELCSAIKCPKLKDFRDAA